MKIRMALVYYFSTLYDFQRFFSFLCEFSVKETYWCWNLWLVTSGTSVIHLGEKVRCVLSVSSSTVCAYILKTEARLSSKVLVANQVSWPRIPQSFLPSVSHSYQTHYYARTLRLFTQQQLASNSKLSMKYSRIRYLYACSISKYSVHLCCSSTRMNCKYQTRIFFYNCDPLWSNMVNTVFITSYWINLGCDFFVDHSMKINLEIFLFQFPDVCWNVWLHGWNFKFAVSR